MDYLLCCMTRFADFPYIYPSGLLNRTDLVKLIFPELSEALFTVTVFLKILFPG